MIITTTIRFPYDSIEISRSGARLVGDTRQYTFDTTKTEKVSASFSAGFDIGTRPFQGNYSPG